MKTYILVPFLLILIPLFFANGESKTSKFCKNDENVIQDSYALGENCGFQSEVIVQYSKTSNDHAMIKVCIPKHNDIDEAALYIPDIIIRGGIIPASNITNVGRPLSFGRAPKNEENHARLVIYDPLGEGFPNCYVEIKNNINGFQIITNKKNQPTTVSKDLISRLEIDRLTIKKKNTKLEKGSPGEKGNLESDAPPPSPFSHSYEPETERNPGSAGK